MPTRWKVIEQRSTTLAPGLPSRIVQHVQLDNGDRIVCPSNAIAAQIVREHNAHAAMVQAVKFVIQTDGERINRTALDRLQAALRVAKGE